MAKGKQGAGIEVPADIRATATRLINDHGELAAAQRLGIARNTVLRLAGGIGVRKGTLVMVRLRIAEIGA